MTSQQGCSCCGFTGKEKEYYHKLIKDAWDKVLNDK